MIAISTIILLLVSSAFGKSCPEDTVDFGAKVENSSIVVYGKTKGKVLYDGNETIFHLQFQVSCILKGPAIEKNINIMLAGKIKIL
jgi:hypothetical protein